MSNGHPFTCLPLAGRLSRPCDSPYFVGEQTCCHFSAGWSSNKQEQIRVCPSVGRPSHQLVAVVCVILAWGQSHLVFYSSCNSQRGYTLYPSRLRSATSSPVGLGYNINPCNSEKIPSSPSQWCFKKRPSHSCLSGRLLSSTSSVSSLLVLCYPDSPLHLVKPKERATQQSRQFLSQSVSTSQAKLTSCWKCYALLIFQPEFGSLYGAVF
jgi:hypothetical protein